MCFQCLKCRFHILVKKKFEGIGENFSELRKKYLWSVWALFVPFLILSLSTTHAIMKFHGWPSVKSEDLGHRAIILWSISGSVIANLPDVISMCIYFRMWKHFRTKVDQGSNLPDDTNWNEVDSYGGIWVGEANELANDYIENAQEQMPPENMNNQVDSANSGHEAKAVMDALRCHMLMALLDVVLGTRALFACSVTKVVLVYCLQVIFVYWIPLIVIVNGFQQIRRHGKCNFRICYLCIDRAPQNL